MGFNFIGAIIGYALGHFVEVILGNSSSKDKQQSNYSYQQHFNQSHRSPFGSYQMPQGENDFISILLILSAAVMKADGRVLKAELNFIKDFFNRQFGNQFTPRHLAFLKEVLDRPQVNINETCSFLRYRTTEEVRIQLIHYLFGIAKADDHVSQQEIDIIYRIARQLHVSDVDFNSIKNMFYRNPSSDYTILGITEHSTDDEVKKAYRKMAIKYHPDKVQAMGEEHQKAAKEKFQQIQEAYENIKKLRNFK